MRYGLIPESPHEEVALAEAPHARVLLDPFLPLVCARALIAFVELGVARALAPEGGRPVGELAAELGLREDGLRPLLRVLVAAGYLALEREPSSGVAGAGGGEERFALTALSRATLLGSSPARLDAWIQHNAVHWQALARLERSLVHGPQDVHHQLDSAAAWATYQRAMLQTARPAADAVAQQLPEPAGRELLLDLGGSHGLYGAAICRRFPPLRARVVDLPEALAHARRLAAEEGIQRLVEHVAGDVTELDLGEEGCDVVFIGNLAHHLDDAQLSDLLRRVRRALRAGGVVAIWEMVPPPPGEPDLVAEGFSLLFHLTSAARCRTSEAFLGALRAAGLEAGAVHRGPSPTHALVTARR